MNIYKCEHMACDDQVTVFSIDRFGHTVTFRWLDPYMGLIVFDGQEDKGFLTTRQFDTLYPDVQCNIIS